MKRFINEDYSSHVANNEFIYFPEEWVNIYEILPDIDPSYWISSYGRIYDEYDRRFLMICIDNENKCCTINIRNLEGSILHVDLSILMLRIFKNLSELKRCMIKYIDGDFTNNDIDNLNIIK